MFKYEVVFQMCCKDFIEIVKHYLIFMKNIKKYNLQRNKLIIIIFEM